MADNVDPEPLDSPTSPGSETEDVSIDKLSKGYNEAVSLVTVGIKEQTSKPSQAEQTFSKAAGLMRNLVSEYGQTSSKEGQRMIKKMRRYIQMIERRNPSATTKQSQSEASKITTNIIDLAEPPSECSPIQAMIQKHSNYGNIFEAMGSAFGFQKDNMRNQEEHVLLLLTNMFLRTPGSEKSENHSQCKAKAVKQFHQRLFQNYRRWCKHVHTKPRIGQDETVDICLFFAIWGEAANFRQTPELLCWLFHHKAQQVMEGALSGRRNSNVSPGHYLETVIRPLYQWLQSENNKKTVKGARESHVNIRNYDDMNEFFWTRRCLKYAEADVSNAFTKTSKSGAPLVAGKTFKERRSWMRVIWSFRRIFRLNCALFVFLCGWAFTMVTTCPEAPFFYKFRGEDEGLNVMGWKMYNDGSTLSRLLMDGARDEEHVSSYLSMAGSTANISGGWDYYPDHGQPVFRGYDTAADHSVRSSSGSSPRVEADQLESAGFLGGRLASAPIHRPVKTIVLERSQSQPRSAPELKAVSTEENDKALDVVPVPSRQLQARQNGCSIPLLASCLGVNVNADKQEEVFNHVPRDFAELLRVVSFSECTSKNSIPSCSCYQKTIERCFKDELIEVREVLTGDAGEDSRYDLATKNQANCVPRWHAGVQAILNDRGMGYLNCDKCQSKYLYLSDMMVANTRIGLYVGGVALCFIIVMELGGYLPAMLSQRYLGSKMPVSFSARFKYSCFWLVIIAFKCVVSYNVMIKPLVDASVFIFYFPDRIGLPSYHYMFRYNFNNAAYIVCLWLPSWLVFMYDLQIWYSVGSLVAGAIRGFNMGIGDIRSYRLMRARFDFLPENFNHKCVGAFITKAPELPGAKTKGKKKRAPSMHVPKRRYDENVSLDGGESPQVAKMLRYSSFYDEELSAVEEGGDDDVKPSSSAGISGYSGPAFDVLVPFALAWNKLLQVMRSEDVISDREEAVLAYQIDGPKARRRSLYFPAFLTAGKLDEAAAIALEYAKVYRELLSEGARGKKKIQQVEKALIEKMSEDSLRMQAVVTTFHTSGVAIKHILGPNHSEIRQVMQFISDKASHRNVLSAIEIESVPALRLAVSELMKCVLEASNFNKDSGRKANPKYKAKVHKVAEKAEVVLSALRALVKRNEEMVKLLDACQMKESSFFFARRDDKSGNYCLEQVDNCISNPAIMAIISRAFYLLTVDNLDAEPKSSEGKRRLRFYTNSLLMNMPAAKLIREMPSLSVATPFYAETAIYSEKELTDFNEDNVNTLFYLQTVYPEEWTNFLERIGAQDGPGALKKNQMETRLWASYRGQTLARTVRGMLYIGEALRLLYWLELGQTEEMHERDCRCNLCKRLSDIVALKFSYVCSCQIYNRQKSTGAQQGFDIDVLLKMHPNLRVAFVDEKKSPEWVSSRFYSVLIRSQNGGTISEVYRVELPGNPIVGEGKPENQNHALIFSRGEFLQAIDMNQDGYFEEWLKMPNLLSTAFQGRDGKKSSANAQPVAIIGFREHVFTGAVSSLAEFMSIQELSFVSLGQRMLAMLNVRMHYGHPDIFDKMNAITNGGTAKPSKVINLSEDIFAGMNATLRGGRVTHEEFIQCGKGRDVGMQQLYLFEAKLSSGAGEATLSRDTCRMANSLDFFRVQSWFYGNLGWYITQTMTVMALFSFIYCRLYISLSGLEEIFLQYGNLGVAGTMNVEWAFQFGFLLALPVVAVVGVEQGFRHGMVYLLWNTVTLGFIYFTFQMGTKMHYFDRTLVHGGAKYRATGRGFVVKHESFSELFRFYANSHIYRGLELVMLLILASYFFTTSWCNCEWTIDVEYYGYVQPTQAEWNRRCYESFYQKCILPTNQNYGLMTFSLWIIAAAWVWAPFFFNPSGLEWEKLVMDYREWELWLERNNETNNSWLGWWLEEHDFLQHSDWKSRSIAVLRKGRFLFLIWAIWYDLAWNIAEEQDIQIVDPATVWAPKPVIRPIGYLFLFALVALMGGVVATAVLGSRVASRMTLRQKGFRKIKFYSFFSLGASVAAMIFLGVPFWGIIEVAFVIFVFIYFLLQYLILTNKRNLPVTRSLAREFDRICGWLVMLPIMFVSMFLEMVSAFQKRIMFNTDFSMSFDVAKMVGRTNVNRELTEKAKPQRELTTSRTPARRYRSSRSMMAKNK